MVDISDMLFIVGHVGHIWRSWETKLYETITRSKVFEVQSFREQIFLGRYWDFFWDQNFWDRYRDFFWDQSFRDRYRDFFSRPNIFETDTETFFLDQIFSRPIPRLFSRPKFSRQRPILSKNWKKVSMLRSLETRCHTLNHCEPFVAKYFGYIHQRSSHGMGQASQIGEQCAGIQVFSCPYMTQSQSQIFWKCTCNLPAKFWRLVGCVLIHSKHEIK